MNHSLRLIAFCGLVACAVLMVAVGMAGRITNLLAPLHLLLLLVIVALYMLPAALAFYRDCDSAMWITVVNVLLGWTVFGWVVALGWAANGKGSILPAKTGAPPTHPLHGALHGD